MDFQKLKIELEALGAPKYRFGQIKTAILKQAVLDFSAISAIPKALAKELEGRVAMLSLEPKKILSARKKDSFKALFRLDGGAEIESVLMKAASGGWSACVSSQAGCAMNCAFCATGKLGFGRNLSAEEITDQILFWQNFIKRQDLDGQLGHIVFMGMGEPFNNWPEVRSALKALIDPEYFGFSSRRISVSTCGIAGGIKKLSDEFPQVNLAVSVIFADDAERGRHMPANRAFGLAKIRQALEQYLLATGRKVFLEYVLFSGLNDTSRHADKLAEFVDSIQNGRKLLQVNLIRYNQAAEGYEPSAAPAALAFKNRLQRRGIGATIRKSLGSDIQAACGQLGSQNP